MRTLDHVVINTRDRTDAAAELFTRLGFQVGARGFHTLGSINHTIVFGTDYLELLGYPPGAPPAKRPELVERPLGLMATVLNAPDADTTRSELLAAGLKPRPVQAFSRPVDLPDGSAGIAAFRVTRLEPDAVPGTWFYFCQQQTPGMVWRPEWQIHANGATGIAAIDIELPDVPAALADYAACTGATPIGSGAGARFDLAGCALRLSRGQGPARMTGLTFRCASLEPVAACIAAARLRSERRDRLIRLDPAECLGATLQFMVTAR
jgi:catechol 2,3-dioxygenase-like lactoylglutathione lyase family enzyme